MYSASPIRIHSSTLCMGKYQRAPPTTGLKMGKIGIYSTSYQHYPKLQGKVLSTSTSTRV